MNNSVITLENETLYTLVYGIEESWEADGSAILRGRIGDNDYSKLLRELRQYIAHRAEKEREILKTMFPGDTLEKKLKSPGNPITQAHVRKAVILHADKIDYSEQIISEQEEFTPERISAFKGLPFAYADSHRHAYDEIIKFLRRSKQKITLLVFDRHDDCAESNYIGKGSYLGHLLKDSGERIAEVLIVSGDIPFNSNLQEHYPKAPDFDAGTNRKYIVYDVPVTLMDIRKLPVIDRPAIVNADLDGTDWVADGVLTKMDSFQYSEYSILNIVRNQHFIPANQGTITIHPRLVAKILRERVLSPEMVFVARERRYRNMVFWPNVEYDFLSGLVE